MTTALGLGANAMYGDQYRIAAALYFVGVSLIVAKLLTLQELRSRGAFATTVVIVLGGALFGGLMGWIDLRKAQVAELRRPEVVYLPRPRQSPPPSRSDEVKASPTAEEIASAVVKKMPPQPPAVITQPTSPAPANLAWTKKARSIRDRFVEFLRTGNRAQNAFWEGYHSGDQQRYARGQAEVERWRTDFGTYCVSQRDLTRNGVCETILSKGHDRISEPLTRIRNAIQNNSIEGWLD